MFPSLNVEYIIVRIVQLILAVPIDAVHIPDRVFFLLESVAVAGSVVSVVFLVLIVYVRVRIIQVEHAGFHAKEAHEHGAHHDDHHEEHTNPQWEIVSALASSPNDSDWRRAILEADIMLGNLLTEHGYPGDSVGEQLRNGNPLQFTTLDLAWEAHRMRNAIAHLGEGFPLSERDARATIDLYRRVFEEFNYI